MKGCVMGNKSKKDLTSYIVAVANLCARGVDVTPEDMAMWIKLHDHENPTGRTLSAYTGTLRRREPHDRPGMEPSVAGPPRRKSIMAEAKKAEQWFAERFFFSEFGPRWQEQIQSALFDAAEIKKFSPSPDDRYVTGQDLRKRWAALENSPASAGAFDGFVRSMIKQDRLVDNHPIAANTKWDADGTPEGERRVEGLPSRNEAIFSMKYVRAVECANRDLLQPRGSRTLTVPTVVPDYGLVEVENVIRKRSSVIADMPAASNLLQKTSRGEKRLVVIVAKLVEAGHLQNEIPKAKNGKAGAKADCLRRIKIDRNAATHFGKNVDSAFEKAWQAGFKEARSSFSLKYGS